MRWKRVFLRMDQWSKTTSHWKRNSDTVQHGELRSHRGSRLVIEFVLRFSSFNFNDTFKTGEASFYIFLKLVFFTNCDNIKWLQCLCQVQMLMIERRNPLFAVKPITSTPKPTKNSQKQIEKVTTTERRNPLFADSGRAPSSSEIPEWLQEFRETLVDDEIPECGDSHASSSHEVFLEPTFKRREDLCKYSVYGHFLQDRTCEICQRTKITRAPCRRRIGRAVPRAENFGDLITADHKVLSENCESRNNHRYAIVVQYLAT